MKKNAFVGLLMAMFLMGAVTYAFSIQPVKAIRTIYIRPDGSIDPLTAPLQRDKNSYTFTDNIYDEVVIERSNIVIDGAHYALEGLGRATGFELRSIDNVIIRNVNIKNFTNAIWLYLSDNNTILENTITNSIWGIYLASSFNNTISGNNVTTNVYAGIELRASFNNTISENNVIANKDFAGISLMGSSKNNVSWNNVANNDMGIALGGSSDNTLSSNKVTANVRGISVWNSNNNRILGNSITAGTYAGIWLEHCENSRISGNTMIESNWGVGLWDSSRNIFYHNNFRNNAMHVYDFFNNSTNDWDNGYPSGGNYWSGYTGTDADDDGISDISYVIDARNQDNYPLMEPWSPPTMIRALLRTVKFWNLPKGTQNSLNSKLIQAIGCLNAGNENATAHLIMAFANQLEALKGKKLTDEDAAYLSSEAQRIIDLIRE